jgi:hypothetical protein
VEKMAATPEQYNSVFNVSPSGQVVLEDLKKAHHFYNSTYTDSPYGTALNEGERNVVLRILTILEQFKEGKNAR